MKPRLVLLAAVVFGAAFAVPVSAGQAAPKPVPKTAPKPKTPAAPPAPVFFTTPLAPAELAGKQAVLETSRGRVVIDLLPEQAPNHVGYFIKLAKEGAYNGTVFHRVIKHGIIQGGDPLSKDAAKRDRYGTGGLGVLQAEPGAGAHVAGAVSAVLVPGKRDSAGAQFFICVTPQAALDGQFTVFGRVVEGLAAVTQLSEAPADASSRPNERLEISSVTIREKPAAVPEPFSTESVAELAAHRAVIETSLGNITVEFFPDKAPAHVRNFLRLASLGIYDGTAFDRVAPAFVIQAGYSGVRAQPMDEVQSKAIRTLAPEFNDTPHEKGILSMARRDDPASASMSFFIVTGRSTALDGKYTAFGRVVSGMDVVDAIEKVERNGEAPVVRVVVTRVRIVR
jgi:peptidyl-prolyl cis-trans isomerase B (cyclophilin B)